MTAGTPATGQLDQLHERVRRAGRSAVLGAGVGLGAGVLISIWLTSADGSVLLWLTVLLVPTALFGAVAGHMAGGGRLVKLVNDAVGSDIAAERIKRAVAGHVENLSPGEQDRAARYAAIAAVALPAQALRWWLLTAAIFSAQALRLITGPALGGLSLDSIISASLGLVSAALLTGTGFAQARTGRQARAYSGAHPLESTGRGPRLRER